MPRGRGALRGTRGRFGNFTTDARVVNHPPGLPPPPPPPRWVSRPTNYTNPPRWRHRHRRWANNPNYQHQGASPDGASGEDYSSLRWTLMAREDQACCYDDPGTQRDHQDIPDACFICGDVLSNHSNEPSIHVCESGEYIITEDQLLPKDLHSQDVDDMKAQLGQAQNVLENMSRQLQDFWDRIRPSTAKTQSWNEDETREGQAADEKAATFADELVENLGEDLEEEYKQFTERIKSQIREKCTTVEEESHRLNKQTCDIESKMETVEQRMKELDIREQEVEDMRQKVQLQRTRYTVENDTEKAEIQRQWQKLRDETKRMEDMHKLQEGRVKLDIGGHVFTTSIATLTRDTDSMLAAMFSGRHKLKKEDDGTVFIDRDGTHFRYILNYLRDGGVLEGSLPEDKQALKELLNESVYYQITGLVEAIETQL